MKRNSRYPRDQHITPFAEILWELCDATGARCCALVDCEGETVDYGGDGDPFDIRILAAEWRLILQRLSEAPILGGTTEMTVRARFRSYAVSTLPEGYALVIELGRRATTVSERALGYAKRRLCLEAGFPPTISIVGDWTSIVVQEEPGHTRRPANVLLGDEKQEVTVIGRVQGPSERGFRVRLSSGDERTLVREPFGHWYIEEDAWSPRSGR
jgi:hypothetical protein